MNKAVANKFSQIVLLIFFLLLSSFGKGSSQTMDNMWHSESSGTEHANIQWFKDAKFGLFIHWGLYAKLAGVWKGERFYGSGEWIMNQGKIPVSEYKKVAAEFNPVNFDADEWTQLASDAGIKYMVITAKHHDGFAMYDSRVSDFDIMDASPYKKDPMKALSVAARKRGIQFGFYYSQFQDWYEPNGGKNTWDFDETKKDYQKYYREKAIPQLKELMTNYGPLGMVWFDTPGGMTKEQTTTFINELRVLQPQSLFSSRVGQGLGDYRDFGDSEIPSTPIKGAWESIFTHNDSWGYIQHDMNFKTPAEIIRLLVNVVSKGGNLMLNVGPDGYGNIPEYSARYLREAGKWLQKNGESIYGTTYGLIPEQPWGVSTSKPGKQYFHVLNRPDNGKLLIPDFNVKISKVYSLSDKRSLVWEKKGRDLWIDLPQFENNAMNKVVVVEYAGQVENYDLSVPVVVSTQFDENIVNAVFAQPSGNTKVNSLTYSHYFGDWKHATCVTGMKDSTDQANFNIRVVDPGDYQVVLEYACSQESAKQEGVVEIEGRKFLFRTLQTSEFNKNSPLMFIKHTVATFSFNSPGNYTIKMNPLKAGRELFKLKSIILKTVK